MNRRAVAAAIGGVALFALVLLWWAASRPGDQPESPRPTLTPTPAEAADATEVRLVFPGRDGLLHSEVRALQLPGDEDEATAMVIASLLAGPLGQELVAPLPGDVSVEAVRVTPDGLAFLLLHGDGEPPSSGSDEERLRIYSLVNTLVSNRPGVERVALLWNDEQRHSLAGHLDTGHALAADPSLEAPAP